MWHQRYRDEGRALVLRTPTPVKVLSKVDQGQFRGCFLGLGPPDFTGVAGGRPVCFDAKDTVNKRWPLRQLDLHQALDLEAWTRAGGLAFVALRLQGVGWVLPWPSLEPIWRTWHVRSGQAASGTASLDEAACAEFGLRMPSPGNWLGALP